MVFYRVDEVNRTVAIIDVLHGMRDLESVLF